MKSSLKITFAAAAVLAVPASGLAADYPPPQVYIPPPPVYAAPEPAFGNWYLRGDIGMSNQRVKKLDNALFNTPGTTVDVVSKGFDSGITYGVGVGYRLKHWARVDITGEYRGKANFRGLDIYQSGGVTGTNDYYGSKSEWLLMTNFYVDLGTWWCLTPFVGLGLGASRNTIHDFRDINMATAGLAYGADASKWNFAWAVHAGVGYEVAPNLTLELSYRYLNLGDAASGDLVTYLGQNDTFNPMEFKGITSHDVRLGMRWNFDCCGLPPPPPPPLITKG